MIIADLDALTETERDGRAGAEPRIAPGACLSPH